MSWPEGSPASCRAEGCPGPALGVSLSPSLRVGNTTFATPACGRRPLAGVIPGHHIWRPHRIVQCKSFEKSKSEFCDCREMQKSKIEKGRDREIRDSRKYKIERKSFAPTKLLRSREW